jgi:DNA repair protein RecO (recombination protein O)
MIEWREDGILLAARRHGESAAIVELFTETHGRHAGVLRGGASRKTAPLLQPGNIFDATWKARLDEHLGSFTLEPRGHRAAKLLNDADALAGLTAITALLSFVLPERQAYPQLHAQTGAMLDMLGQEFWPLAYIRWEMSLLETMGFGLDLSACAVRGVNEDLAFVSPRTGRAVSREGAGDYADRLLPLSPALIGRGDGGREDIGAALKTTGHFLENVLAASLGDRPVPPSRRRLVDRLTRG